MIARNMIVAVALTACGSTPPTPPFSVYGSCAILPNEWRQIEAPPNRGELLNLPEEVGKMPVRESFGMSGAQREAWFEDKSQRLQACLYSPETSCYIGELHKVIFTKVGELWKAGPATRTICVDEVAGHNKRLVPTHTGEAPVFAAQPQRWA